jgi:outer membrane protein TolC
MTAAIPRILIAVASTQSAPDLARVFADVDATFPKLQAARQTVAVAKGKVQEKQGAFDPVLTVDTATQRYNSSSSRGKGLTYEMLETSVEQTTRSGVKLLAGSRLNFSSVKSPASSTGELGEYYVGVKVPLQRDNLVNSKNVSEQIAQLEVYQLEEDVKAVRNGIRLTVASAFWELIAARQKQAIARQLLELARVRSE